MEYVKAPTYPMAPMPMPTPIPAPMPMPMPMPMPVQQAPIMQSPIHNDIHLHASYQQTSYVFPKPAVHHHPVAKVSSYNSVGSILVLFILLVIITRGICKY
ncbi:hypothetical protein GC102_26390 [Paenibacillus sp. LMG 31460]|uniref:Uncharacterized protein n=1 Tax=Paenibacillus germinis TaxID=2654979 RepID=A0ABX1Z7K0_9BACL|nr:hypothetical protein [Paenibacillus germinis]NOU89253.1 hypothetical protein [Paenibacillus germinis]